MTDIAIRVENLGKRYQLGPSKSGSFRESLSHLFRRETGDRRPETGEKDTSSVLRSPSSVVPSSHPEDQPVTSHSESQPATFNQDFWALQDINFEIKRGEAVGIIGRNGAGKSTLLKILSRITEPTKGRFEIFGRVSSLLEVGTGFHPELTGRENVYLNGTILGMKRREVRAKFDEIVAFSGVEKFIDTPVKHYSSGMQVRLAFAVAAHLEPEILIIDEVLAVGDAEFQKKCLGKMEDVSGEGRTVLFVSHNMEAVDSLCQKSILLNKGNVKAFGISSDIIAKYQTSFSSCTFPLKLSDSITLNSIDTDREIMSQYDNIILSVKFTKFREERIDECCLLIYNYLNQRIGIIDLREFNIQNVSVDTSELKITVSILDLPLMEGIYSIGLFVSSVSVRGDFYDLKKIAVQPKKQSFAPYRQKDRGLINFKAEATLN